MEEHALTALDRLMDLAWDYGPCSPPRVTWGEERDARYGQQPKVTHWVAVRLDRTIEQQAHSRDNAAWIILHELCPGPADQPEDIA